MDDRLIVLCAREGCTNPIRNTRSLYCSKSCSQFVRGKRYTQKYPAKAIARTLKWRNKNKEWIRNYDRRLYHKTRASVLVHYGGKCVCCGETAAEFLTID